MLFVGGRQVSCITIFQCSFNGNIISMCVCVCVVVFGRCNCTTFAILHLSISNFINFYNFLIIRNILYVCNFFALYISMDERLSLSNWFSSILHRGKKRAADFHERSFVFPGIPSSWKTSPTKQNSILPSQNWSSCHFSPFSNFDLSWDFPFLGPGFCEFKNCSPLCADIIPLYTCGNLYFFFLYREPLRNHFYNALFLLFRDNNRKYSMENVSFIIENRNQSSWTLSALQNISRINSAFIFYRRT